MLWTLLFLACGDKGDSDTATSEAVSQEDPNPQYIGGYNTNVCETLPESNGYATGEVSYDFELMDQHGEMVSLSDFCDNTVLLVSSAFWCGSCRSEAPELEALYQKYKDSNFTVITLIGKNAADEAPSQEDLQQWASDYGLNHPVLADPEYSVVVNYLWANPTFTGSIALPNMQLLSGGMVVEMSNVQVSEADLIPYIEGGE